MRVLAVDWSGKLKRAEESLWLAEVRTGELVDLRNGLSRDQLVQRLVDLAREEPQTVVGLDFAFSFPRWWCEQEGLTTGREVWGAMNGRAEELLDACEEPFWGRPGKVKPKMPNKRLYRRTDLDAGVGTPKSVFQINGPGAVGTGSIRGMPHLLTLSDHEFSVWPFEDDGWPRVVEIYPRALTDAVNKSSWAERHAYLFQRFPEQPGALLERAAGSEDAFDAAVSALVMDAHRKELAGLTRKSDPDYSIEGMIWRPPS